MLDQGEGPVTREVCSECDRLSRVGFHVPNEIWLQAIPVDRQEDIFCVACFTRFADRKYLAWDREIRFFPVSKKTHREGLAAPGMTDLMVSPESITPGMMELEDVPPIQTADDGEAFQGPTTHSCCGCSCHVCADGHRTGLHTEACQSQVTWPIREEPETRAERGDRLAERYTWEDGSPK